MSSSTWFKREENYTSVKRSDFDQISKAAFQRNKKRLLIVSTFGFVSGFIMFCVEMLKMCPKIAAVSHFRGASAQNYESI